MDVFKMENSHKWPLRKEHDYNPLGFAPYFQTNPSNFQLNHNLKSMSSHIFMTNAHNYSVFYKYSQTLIFLININVEFSISSYQARVTFVQTVADLVWRQVVKRSGGSGYEAPASYGLREKTCYSIWGVLKMEDPQVTMGFNAKMVQVWMILGVATISGNLHLSIIKYDNFRFNIF
jgi:hypothetical protein